MATAMSVSRSAPCRFFGLNGQLAPPMPLSSFAPNQPGPGFIGSRKRSLFENLHFCWTYATMRAQQQLNESFEARVFRFLPGPHYAVVEGVTLEQDELVFSWVNNENFLPKSSTHFIKGTAPNDSGYVIYGTLTYLRALNWVWDRGGGGDTASIQGADAEKQMIARIRRGA